MSKTDQYAPALRRAYLFAQMPDEQLQILCTSMQEIPLANGEGLFRHGQPAERFFYVFEGLIKLFRLSPDGGEKIIEIIRPGETFAEAVMFMGPHGRYPVSAAAVADSHLLGFSQKNYLGLLRESPDLCFGFLKFQMTNRMLGAGVGFPGEFAFFRFDIRTDKKTPVPGHFPETRETPIGSDPVNPGAEFGFPTKLGKRLISFSKHISGQVATTIIESGLDLPQVNTLIVERADMLGLAQLYQLRGRVGRSSQRAYAYLFHPEDQRLSEEAHRRLESRSVVGKIVLTI